MYRMATGSRGRAVKVSARGNVRPSAAYAYYERGARIGAVTCYDGKCKRLRLNVNGDPYWGAFV